MSKWETHLRDVLYIIKTSSTSNEVVDRCAELLGEPNLTYNAVSAALRRLRRDKGYRDIPPIDELLGSSLDDDGIDISFEEEDVEDYVVKLPKAAKGFAVLPKITSVSWLPKRIAVIPDIHFPIEDPYALAAMVAYLRDYKPDYAVFLGDVLDCSCLSRHASSHVAEKLMDIKYKLDEEIKASKPTIQEMISITNGNVAWIEGNHEFRRQNILNANPGLVGLSALEAKNLFEIPKEVLWIANDERLKIGPVYFEHGDKIINSKGSNQVANSMASRRPFCNTFVGHWHCVDRKTRVVYHPDGQHEAFITATVGHLSIVEDHRQYAVLPNWSHGFATIETWVEDGKQKFSFDQIEMLNYSFSRNGKVYSGLKLM